MIEIDKSRINFVYSLPTLQVICMLNVINLSLNGPLFLLVKNI